MKIVKGLEGVYVGETKLGSIDGEKGVLLYNGYDINDLADHAMYEEVLYLLWEGKLPNQKQLNTFSAELKKHRPLPAFMMKWLKAIPRSACSMDVLRTMVSALSFHQPCVANPKDAEREGIRIAAKLPTIVAAFERRKQGKNILQPNNKLNHAANFLYMIRGEKPNKEEARIMDICFILHAEHGLNASAFSARVTVSTLSDVYAGVTSGIGTLKGPLHGGANEAVLHMLQKIKTVKNVEPFILNKLKRHEKIMGVGHRVYKVKDPRAKILEKYSEQLSLHNDPKWYEMSVEVERIVQKALGKKHIYPNVDFYSASVYHYLGIRAEIFPAIFACSRIGGWMGHIIEQYHDNRLIRPRAVYTGSKKRRFVPLEKRT